MPKRPKVRMSRLRDIGWKLWDPIGLRADGEDWDGEDEYDSYLLQVAGMVRQGAPFADIVDYLIWVETEWMGLTPVPAARAQAETVVKAIQADDQIWSD